MKKNTKSMFVGTKPGQKSLWHIFLQGWHRRCQCIGERSWKKQYEEFNEYKSRRSIAAIYNSIFCSFRIFNFIFLQMFYFILFIFISFFSSLIPLTLENFPLKYTLTKNDLCRPRLLNVLAAFSVEMNPKNIFGKKFTFHTKWFSTVNV